MDKRSDRIAQGDLRTLLQVALPILFFSFCEALTIFAERVLLSYHSQEAVAGSLNATYLATFFYGPIVAIAVMAQVFVGTYYGSKKYHQIGPCVWQLVWFSVLASLVAIPLSILVSNFYFKQTVIEDVGKQYFSVLAIGNLLFPLIAALSSFFLGRGKTFLVTFTMLTSYVLQLGLCWLLTFGWEGYIPPLGPKGAALAKCLSLGWVAVIFFTVFLNRKNHERYQTRNWTFSLQALWYYIRPGLVRAFGFLSAKGFWNTITYLIVKEGGEYLNVLTVGGTINILLLFITTSLYKANLIITGNLIGTNRYEEIKKLCLSFIIFSGGIALFLTVPLLLFPNSLMYFFDLASREVFLTTFQNINHWIWIFTLAMAIQQCLCAVLVALRETSYPFLCYLCICPLTFCLVYFGLIHGRWQPDKLWLIMALENLVIIICFCTRLAQKFRLKQQAAL